MSELKLKHLAKNLGLLRKEKKLTENEMQAHIGIDGTTWSDYENGVTEPAIDALIKISRFFYIRLDHLILKDLSKDPDGVNQDSDLWREVKQLRQELDVHKKDLEHVKKIIAKR